jgi:hypothetical protein
MANRTVTLLASAARTATNNSATVNNPRGKAIRFTVDCTARAGSASTVFTFQGLDQVSGKYYTLLASAAVTTAATTQYNIGLGSTVTANVSANVPAPVAFRVLATHGTADAHTYSVSAEILE